MTDSIAIMIKALSQEFDKLSNRVLAQYDMTGSQYKIVKYIMRKPDCSVRQIDIEKFFSMTNPTVTGLLHNLEKKGFIERDINPEDKRSKIIRVTDKVHSMEDQITQAGLSLEEEFTRKLTDREKKTLRTLLAKML